MRTVFLLLAVAAVVLLALTQPVRASLPTGTTVEVTKQPELVWVVNPQNKSGQWFVQAQVTVTSPDPAPCAWMAVNMTFLDYPDAVGQSFWSDPATPGVWVVNFFCPAPFGGFADDGSGWVCLNYWWGNPNATGGYEGLGDYATAIP